MSRMWHSWSNDHIIICVSDLNKLPLKLGLTIQDTQWLTDGLQYAPLYNWIYDDSLIAPTPIPWEAIGYIF